jgi:hypothetical protein
MSDSDQDDEFEAYLKRRVPIDKGLKSLDSLEPPAELDRIVIGKARKAIHGASPLHTYRAPKWALPVGLAATILLSFAILLNLGVRAKRNDASLHAALSETSARAPSQGQSEPASPAPSTAAAPAVTRAAETEQEFSSDKARTRLARAEKAAKRARPEPETADTKTLQEEVVVNAQRRTAADAAYSTASPIAAAPADTAVSSSTASVDNTVSAIESSMNKPSAPAPAVAPASGATSVAMPIPAPPASRSAPNTTKRETLEPATWLAKIDKLRSSGHTAEAESEMKRFRETYPDYPVPKADP